MLENILKPNLPKDTSQRLQQQIRFVLELDRLKRVLRRSPHLEGTQKENDAEHSWHLAMMAFLLAEYADPRVEINRVIKMLLIHDIVEIEAGDTFLYDNSGYSDTKCEREEKAAEKLYGILPDDIGKELMILWQEFECGQTEDAKFAAGLDRLQPLLLNYFSEGGTWKYPGVTKDRVVSIKKKKIQDASPVLWEFAEALIAGAVSNGYLDDNSPVNISKGS